MDHKNVIKTYEIFESMHSIYIVMDIFKGKIYNYIYNKKDHFFKLIIFMKKRGNFRRIY